MNLISHFAFKEALVIPISIKIAKNEKHLGLNPFRSEAKNRLYKSSLAES